MSIWVRPALWLRIAIVVVAFLGLSFRDNSLVYYTVQTNLIVLAYYGFTAYRMIVERDPITPAPRWRGALTFWIAITGLVAHFLLNNGTNPLPPLVGDGDLVAEWAVFALHYVVPVLVFVDFLAVPPHAVIPWRNLPSWLLFPMGYGFFAELRAAVYPGFPTPYPYYFLDPTDNGYLWVAGQFGLLLVEFSVLAAIILGADRLRGRFSLARTPVGR